MSSATHVAADLAAFSASASRYAPLTDSPQECVRATVDGAAPRLIVRPSDSESVRRVLSEAQIQHVAVVPVGSGRHRALGNPPRRYDVALSLDAMGAIVAHEPADMTLTVQAGARLGEIQAALAAHGQFLPLDPPDAQHATVGGVLASNAFGPARHAFGTARDWLIGIRVAHADGAESKSGGRVVKNVTGYDMHKLYIGSLGTLGVITEATFKVAPLPHAQQPVALTFADATSAAAAALTARDRGVALHALELLSPPAAHRVTGEGGWTLLTLVAGGKGAVQRTLRELREIAGHHAGSVADPPASAWTAWSAAFATDGLALRIAAPPSEAGAMIERLDRRYAGDAARLSATIAAGVVRARFDHASDDRAIALIGVSRDVAARHHASCVVESAPPDVKRAIGDVFGPTRDDFAIMRRLKDALDPQQVLAPGRFVGGI